MPEIGEERLILSKREWEELEELNFKENQSLDKEDGSRTWKREIIIKDAKIFIEDYEPNVYYPYITYINEKGEQKTERLNRASPNLYTSFNLRNPPKRKLVERSDLSSLVEYLRDLVKNKGVTESFDDLVVMKTKEMLEWLCRSIDLKYNLKISYFPVPAIISLTRSHERNYGDIILYTYQIKETSYTPKYLGECKYGE